jgi:hypothetical protein
MKNTITYSEKAKGWTSFHSFLPDLMGRLNNRFFSIKSGQLYLHNDETNPVRNNFYGQQFSSKIKTIFSDAPSDDKIYKTMVLEGNRPWHVNLKTNMAESTLDSSEFNARESRYFAYIRKNENNTDFTGHTAQGIGVIVSSLTNVITFNFVSDMIAVGDGLFQLNGGGDELIGTITSIVNNRITVAAIVNNPVNGFFCFGKKDARIEGGEIRGYYMEAELTNSDTQAVELFAINTNAIKSYV